MSRSYGEYSRLQGEVYRLDSLLWLGQLSEAEFDSVIAEVREQKLAEIEQQEREQRRQQMVTVADMDEMGTQADEDTDNGFLNHKNQQLMMQNRQAFQAFWGARPLVDDWRRMEAVSVNIVRQFEEEGEAGRRCGPGHRTGCCAAAAAGSRDRSYGDSLYTGRTGGDPPDDRIP
jgi:hypothetical protein